MSEWKFQKATDVEPDWGYIGYLADMEYFNKRIIKEMYVPDTYLPIDRKDNDVSPPKLS